MAHQPLTPLAIECGVRGRDVWQVFTCVCFACLYRNFPAFLIYAKFNVASAAFGFAQACSPSFATECTTVGHTALYSLVQ